MSSREISLIAFAVFTLLWLAFGATLLFNREVLDAAWQTFRSWPLIVQLVLGLLFLPVVFGLWIWESSLPLMVRLILIVGLAIATEYLFFPRRAGGGPVGGDAEG